MSKFHSSDFFHQITQHYIIVSLLFRMFIGSSSGLQSSESKFCCKLSSNARLDSIPTQFALVDLPFQTKIRPYTRQFTSSLRFNMHAIIIARG